MSIISFCEFCRAKANIVDKFKTDYQYCIAADEGFSYLLIGGDVVLQWVCPTKGITNVVMDKPKWSKAYWNFKTSDRVMKTRNLISSRGSFGPKALTLKRKRDLRDVSTQQLDEEVRQPLSNDTIDTPMEYGEDVDPDVHYKNGSVWVKYNIV